MKTYLSMTQIKRAADFVTSKLLMWVLTAMGGVIIYFVQDMHSDFKSMRGDIGGLKINDARQDERFISIEKVVFDLSPAKHEPSLSVPNPNN